MRETDNQMFGSIISDHLSHGRQIFFLAWLDMKRKYRKATFGWAWALVRPLIMLFVYWFAMRIGLRSQASTAQGDFFAWLATGLIAWFFISDVMNDSTRIMHTYKYLVTKMRFPVSAIPTVSVISNGIIHVLLLVVVLLYLLFTGSFSIYWLQLPFYTLAMVLFGVGWSLFAGLLSAVSKDFGEMVKSVVRILFWLSGILWNAQTVSIGWLRTIQLFNPITFFADGYRNALVGERWFWQDWQPVGGFVMVLFILWFIAVATYKRTRTELADVL